MSFDYQPVLKGELVELRPLRAEDYDDLYAVAADPLPDLGNRPSGVVVVGEIDLDVIFRAGAPWAYFRKGVPGAGDDSPAGRGEALHGGVTDTARRPGQDQRLLVRV